jgi:hypothetical protein
MSKSVLEYRCLLISPSDVSSESDAVTEILAKWNAQIGTALGARVELVKWESHSTPDLSAPPQEVLNEQLLPDCDFAVAIFWSRLGTPTENYESGSVEEIDKLLQDGKRVLVYFNTSPIPQGRLEDDQFERLQKVKKRYLEQGLLSTYENTEELKVNIQNHLASVVNSLLSKNGRSTRGSSPTGLAEKPAIKIEVAVDVVKLPSSDIKKFIVVSVQNHSNKIFHMQNIYVQNKDRSLIYIPQDTLTGNYQSNRDLKSERTHKFHFDPITLKELENIKISGLKNIIVKDEIGRRYESSEDEFRNVLKALFPQESEQDCI